MAFLNQKYCTITKCYFIFISVWGANVWVQDCGNIYVNLRTKVNMRVNI